MHALKISLQVESPFATTSGVEAAFPIDNVLPRALHTSKPIIPGTLLRGVLRDVLGTLLARGNGRLPGVATDDAVRLIGELFGRPSGADPRGAGYDVPADGTNNDPQRGGIVVEDLTADEVAKDFQKTTTRISIDPTFGSAKEGALQVIECPWPIGEAVKFSGRILITPAIDVDVAQNALGLALSAIDALGAYKSAGFGRVVEASLQRDDAAIDEQRRRREAILAVRPAQTPRTWRVVLSVDRPFLVSADRVAPNLFRGAETIPGGTVKGSFAQALRDRLERDADFSALLSRTVFSQFCPVAAETPSKALNAPLELPIPMSLGCYETRTKSVVVRDTILDAFPGIRIDGGDTSAPLFQIDWKDKHRDAVRKRAAQLSIALPPDPSSVVREIRVRTAIDYDKGTASYDENGGGLFVYSAVAPRIRTEKGNLTPLYYVGEVSAATAEAAECAAVQDLLRELVDHSGWIGKTDATIDVVALGPSPAAKPVPPIDQFKKLYYPIVLRTPALMTPIDALRRVGGDVGTVYADYFASRAGDHGLKLVRYRARQRLIGGYQVFRFRPEGSAYDPFVVTEPGSTFLLEADPARKSEAQAWMNERLLMGLTEADDDGPDETRWRRLPLARTNGFGAIALDPWVVTWQDKQWQSIGADPADTEAGHAS